MKMSSGSFMFAEGEYRLREGELSFDSGIVLVWLTQALLHDDDRATTLNPLDIAIPQVGPQLLEGRKTYFKRPFTWFTGDWTAFPRGTYKACASIVTIDNEPISYNWFGGTNEVKNGDFTVVWHDSGICNLTGRLQPYRGEETILDIDKAAEEVAQWLTSAASE